MVKRVALIGLCVFFLLVRVIPILGSHFPFAYDNAKDSLAMLTMWQTHRPVFLGPVTSLEGLYQGPLWYYVALPANVIFHFHPFASVLTVLLLGLISLYLLVKKIGWWEGLFYTTSGAMIATHQTAWAPYIMQFPVLFSLIWLWRLPKVVKTRDAVFVGACLGAMFHFEIAFAVVYIPFFLLSLILQKVTIKLQTLLLGLLTCSLFFIPHFVFELKHHFLQTHGVIQFITHIGSAQSTVAGKMTLLQRMATLVWGYIGGAPGAIMPLGGWLSVVIGLLLMGTALPLMRKGTIAERMRFHLIVLPLFIGTALLYVVLPFKPFYLVSFLPLWMMIAVSFVRRLRYPIRIAVLVGVLIASAIGTIQNKLQYDQVAQETPILFSSRQKAVETVERLANGQPFSSYQYVPEVYDFTYQLTYWQEAAAHHTKLPNEISYQPGISDYNPWAFPVHHQPGERTFLIVEKDDRPNFLPNWWQTMTSGKRILQTVPVNEAITVYELTNNL